MAQAPPFSVRLPQDLHDKLGVRLGVTKEARNAMIVRLIRSELGVTAPKQAAKAATSSVAGLAIRRPKYGALLEKKGREKWRL